MILKELKEKTFCCKIKFMINNVKYNKKEKYSNIFEDFLKKNI